MLSAPLIAAALSLSLITTAYESNLTVLVNGEPGCTGGARLILARGSNAPQYEPTWLDAIAETIVNEVADSATYSLIYPALLNGNDADYTFSEQAGVSNLNLTIQQFVAECPSQRIALIGYSQGAQVVGDALIGISSISSGIPSECRKNIVAVVLFGDPTHVANFSIDVGTSTRNGQIIRDNTEQYYVDGFAPNMHSYCDENDPVCDDGPSGDIAVHFSYDSTYCAAAASFLIDRIAASM